MVFRNRDGDAVDPVPFLVTTLLLGLIILSWGPGYLLAFDVSLFTAILMSVVATAACAAGAYHRLIWTFNPEVALLRAPEDRIRHLAYLALLGALVLVLLAIPLYARLA